MGKKRGVRSSVQLSKDRSKSMFGAMSYERYSSRLRLPSNKNEKQDFIKHEPNKTTTMKQRVDYYMKLMDKEDPTLVLSNDSR